MRFSGKMKAEQLIGSKDGLKTSKTTPKGHKYIEVSFVEMRDKLGGFGICSNYLDN